VAKKNGWETDSYGNKCHYRNGVCHCDFGPAILREDGGQAWYKDGQLHRLDGPAYVGRNGEKEWYKDGLRHRDFGPAIDWTDGTKFWYKEGLPHNETGPAYIGASGTLGWYIKGSALSETEFNKKYRVKKVTKKKQTKKMWVVCLENNIESGKYYFYNTPEEAVKNYIEDEFLTDKDNKSILSVYELNAPVAKFEVSPPILKTTFKKIK